MQIPKVLSEGVQLWQGFFRGARLQRPPKECNYQSASKTPLMNFHWLADYGPLLNADLTALWFSGIRISITRKPYKFVIFQGGGCPDPLTPLWIRTCIDVNKVYALHSFMFNVYSNWSIQSNVLHCNTSCMSNNVDPCSDCLNPGSLQHDCKIVDRDLKHHFKRINDLFFI